MYQLLTEEGGNPVAEFSLYKLANAGNVVAGATIAAPLGTLLSEEIKLSVDGGRSKSYAFSFCTMGGCFARIGLTEPEVEALKRGVTATLEIVPAQAPDQTVTIEASLSGFTDAYEAASELQN
jgi:invasion protein IalB